MMNRNEAADVIRQYDCVTEFGGVPTINNMLLVAQIEATHHLASEAGLARDTNILLIETNRLLGRIATSLEEMEPKPSWWSRFKAGFNS